MEEMGSNTSSTIDPEMEEKSRLQSAINSTIDSIISSVTTFKIEENQKLPEEVPKEIPKEIPKELPKELPKEYRDGIKELYDYLKSKKEEPKEIPKEEPNEKQKEIHQESIKDLLKGELKEQKVTDLSSISEIPLKEQTYDMGNPLIVLSKEEIRKHRELIREIDAKWRQEPFRCSLCNCDIPNTKEYNIHYVYCRVKYIHSYWKKNIQQLTKIKYRCPICLFQSLVENSFIAHIDVCKSHSMKPYIEEREERINSTEYENYKYLEVSRLEHILPECDGMEIQELVKKNWKEIMEIRKYGIMYEMLSHYKQQEIQPTFGFSGTSSSPYVQDHAINRRRGGYSLSSSSRPITRNYQPYQQHQLSFPIPTQTQIEVPRTRHEVIDPNTAKDNLASDNKDDKLCKVCFDSSMDCAIVPCGHVATCNSCTQKINECVICRGKIEKVIKLYYQ